MAISIGSNSSSTGSRGSGISSRLDFSNVMSLAKDFRDVYEKEQKRFDEQATEIENLRAILDPERDGVAYQTFMNFYNPLHAEIEKFSRNGMDASTLHNFNNLRDQYRTKITDIATAAAARNALALSQEEYRRSHPNDQIIFENDAETIGVDKFMDNYNLGSGKIIDLNTVTAQMAAVVTAYNDWVREEDKDGNNNVSETTPLLTHSSLMTFMDPNERAAHREDADQQVLGTITDRVFKSNGIIDADGNYASFLSPSQIEAINNRTAYGMVQGVGESSSRRAGGGSSGGTSTHKAQIKEWKEEYGTNAYVNTLGGYNGGTFLTPMYNEEGLETDDTFESEAVKLSVGHRVKIKDILSSQEIDSRKEGDIKPRVVFYSNDAYSTAELKANTTDPNNITFSLEPMTTSLGTYTFSEGTPNEEDDVSSYNWIYVPYGSKSAEQITYNTGVKINEDVYVGYKDVNTKYSEPNNTNTKEGTGTIYIIFSASGGDNVNIENKKYDSDLRAFTVDE